MDLDADQGKILEDSQMLEVYNNYNSSGALETQDQNTGTKKRPRDPNNDQDNITTKKLKKAISESPKSKEVKLKVQPKKRGRTSEELRNQKRQRFDKRSSSESPVKVSSKDRTREKPHDQTTKHRSAAKTTKGKSLSHVPDVRKDIGAAGARKKTRPGNETTTPAGRETRPAPGTEAPPTRNFNRTPKGRRREDAVVQVAPIIQDDDQGDKFVIDLKDQTQLNAFFYDIEHANNAEYSGTGNQQAQWRMNKIAMRYVAGYVKKQLNWTKISLIEKIRSMKNKIHTRARDALNVYFARRDALFKQTNTFRDLDQTHQTRIINLLQQNPDTSKRVIGFKEDFYKSLLAAVYKNKKDDDKKTKKKLVQREDYDKVDEMVMNSYEEEESNTQDDEQSKTSDEEDDVQNPNTSSEEAQQKSNTSDEEDDEQRELQDEETSEKQKSNTSDQEDTSSELEDGSISIIY